MSAGLFDRVAEAIERGSSLNRVEARGALRLVLQTAGLDPRTLAPEHLVGPLRDAVPRDLAERGVLFADELYGRILQELAPNAVAPVSAPPAPTPARPIASAPTVEGALPTLFDWVADALTKVAGMEPLPARGTLRLAVKDAGLLMGELDKEQVAALLAQVLPNNLRRQGVPDPDAVCRNILVWLPSALVQEANAARSPEHVSLRLGARDEPSPGKPGRSK